MVRGAVLTMLSALLLVAADAALADEPSVTEPGMPWPVVEDRGGTASASESTPDPAAEHHVTEPGIPWPVVQDGAGGAAAQSEAMPVPATNTAGTNTATEPGMPWPVVTDEEARRLKAAAPAPAVISGEAAGGPERAVTEPGIPWPVVQEPPRAAAPAAPARKAPAREAAPNEGDDQAQRAACTKALKSALGAGPMTFAAGGTEILAASRPVLTQVAAAVKACGGLSILIVGHTDSRGSPRENLALSKARAAAVARFLARLGIAEARLRTEGYGADRPIASNETAEGRAKNRRIEIMIAPGGSGPS